MRKIIVFLLLSCCFLTLSAQADNTPERNTLTISGEASTQAKPDVVYVTLGVQRDGLTAQEAQDVLKNAVNKVMESLTRLDIDPEKLKTQEYSLQPIYRQRKIEDPSSEAEIIKYRAYVEIVCELAQVSQLPKVLDSTITAGANRINNIDFTLKDRKAAYEDALKKAIENAETKAKLMAEKLNVTIIQPITIQEQSAPAYYGKRVMFSMAEARGASDINLPSGTLDINANVNIVYEIQKN